MVLRELAIMQRLDECIKNGRLRMDQPIMVEALPDGTLPNYETDSAIDMDEEPDQMNLELALKMGSFIKTKSNYEPDEGSIRSPASGQSRAVSSYESQLDLTGLAAHFPQTPGTARTSILSFGPNTIYGEAQLPSESDDKALVDSTPYFDDTTPREVLEALIERFKAQATSEFKKGNYRQAEENQLEVITRLDELYVGYGVPFDEFEKERLFLGDIYFEQEKYDDARRIATDFTSQPGSNFVKAPTMVDAGVVPMNARRYHLLARTHRKMYLLAETEERQNLFLNAAERDAKRAFICGYETRQSSDCDFIQAVNLLIQIYKDKGKWAHVATYREIFLPQDRTSQLGAPHETSPHSSHDSLVTTLAPDSIMAGPIDNELCRAVTNGREELIDELVLSTDQETQQKALLLAVDLANEHAIHRLQQSGLRLEEALFHAVKTGKKDMTHLLLVLDADKEARNASGATPFLVAAAGSHLSVLRELLKDGVNVDAVDSQGWSAIHLAAHKGDIEVMRILLEPKHRIDFDTACPTGKTALHYLAERDNVEIGRLLLEHNADPNIRDKTTIGRTPFYIAATQAKYNFVQMLLGFGVTYDRDELPCKSQSINNLLDRNEQLQSAASVTSDSSRRPSLMSTRSSQQSRSSFSIGAVTSRWKKKSHKSSSSTSTIDDVKNQPPNSAGSTPPRRNNLNPFDKKENWLP